MNILHRPVVFEFDELVILSGERRLYAALASKGDSVHVVQPARIDDARVGDGKVLAGDLVCTCPAGQFARVCWVVRFARAYEAGEIGRAPVLRQLPIPDEAIAWMQDALATEPEQEVLA